LVNNRYIVTAAHCFGSGSDYQTKYAQMVVKLGVFDTGMTLSANEQQQIVRGVSKVTIHPEWQDGVAGHSQMHGDIAVIELNQPVTYTDAVKPICLPDASENFQNPRKFLISGWGLTSSGGSTSNTLQQAIIDGKDLNSCRNVYGSGVVDDMMICAVTPGQGTCQGDSGGPLAWYNQDHWELAGIVSFGGPSCADARYPSVYTHVPSYLSWVKQQIGM